VPDLEQVQNTECLIFVHILVAMMHFLRLTQ